jgi:uncharacterized protein (TIGR02444 family)
MTAFPDHAVWDFAVRTYGAPGVAPACLELQERHGINVALMLFCLWRGTLGDMRLREYLPAVAASAQAWHEATALPIRAARRWLKSNADQLGQPAGTALYRTVLSAEIDCEHGELLLLARQAEAFGEPSGAAPPAAIGESLSAFFAVSGVDLVTPDHVALSTILAAVGAAGEISRLLPPRPSPAG